MRCFKNPQGCQARDSFHFAIAEENDEYLGTISLKEIDLENQSPEYAIATRKKAQGHGVAKQVTGMLLKKHLVNMDCTECI